MSRKNYRLYNGVTCVDDFVNETNIEEIRNAYFEYANLSIEEVNRLIKLKLDTIRSSLKKGTEEIKDLKPVQLKTKMPDCFVSPVTFPAVLFRGQ